MSQAPGRAVPEIAIRVGPVGEELAHHLALLREHGGPQRRKAVPEGRLDVGAARQQVRHRLALEVQHRGQQWRDGHHPALVRRVVREEVSNDCLLARMFDPRSSAGSVGVDHAEQKQDPGGPIGHAPFVNPCACIEEHLDRIPIAVVGSQCER